MQLCPMRYSKILFTRIQLIHVSSMRTWNYCQPRFFANCNEAKTLSMCTRRQSRLRSHFTDKITFSMKKNKSVIRGNWRHCTISQCCLLSSDRGQLRETCMWKVLCNPRSFGKLFKALLSGCASVDLFWIKWWYHMKLRGDWMKRVDGWKHLRVAWGQRLFKKLLIGC